MCGICGVFAMTGPLDPEVRAALPAMNGALAHRGPDGDGFFDDTRVALGHRRLAIIDRAGGHQPMANEDGTCWIVFNGEIYNHRALRPLLEAKGHRFRTSSDTETILHAYEEFGPGVRRPPRRHVRVRDLRRTPPGAVRGARSPRQEAVLLHRARRHAFTSPASCRRSRTVAALARRRRSDRARRLSLARLLRRARHDLSRRPQAPAGTLAARCRRPGRDRASTGTSGSSTPTTGPTSELLDEIDATLRQAVHDRLESEVPLGAFLSGGIDSGLVVSYMAEALGDRLVTASVGFGDAAHNELEAAGVVGRAFPTAGTTRRSIEPRSRRSDRTR